MGIGRATLRGLGRAVSSKPGMIGVMGVAAGAGLIGQTAPAMRDAAMDVAFGDPNADSAFLGRKLTPGAVADTMVPGARTGTGALAIGGLTTLGGAAVGGLIGSTRGIRGGIKGSLIGAAAGAMVGRSRDSCTRGCIYQ